MQVDSLAYSRRKAVLRFSLRSIDYLLARGKLRRRRIGRPFLQGSTSVEVSAK